MLNSNTGRLPYRSLNNPNTGAATNSQKANNAVMMPTKDAICVCVYFATRNGNTGCKMPMADRSMKVARSNTEKGFAFFSFINRICKIKQAGMWLSTRAEV